MREKVREYFKDFYSYLNLTLDGWSSPNGIPVLAVTGHWIDSNWQMRKWVVDVVEIPGSHTGKKLAELVLGILKDFGLTTKIFCITGDNASSNKALA